MREPLICSQLVRSTGETPMAMVPEVGAASWDGARNLGVSGQIVPALDRVLRRLVGMGNPTHTHVCVPMHTCTHTRRATRTQKTRLPWPSAVAHVTGMVFKEDTLIPLSLWLHSVVRDCSSQ